MLKHDDLTAATIAACSAAFCYPIKYRTFFLASALLRDASWLGVAARKMVADAVGMSDVPRSSGGNFKLSSIVFFCVQGSNSNVESQIYWLRLCGGSFGR
jgi:hypothetical protein